MQQSGIQVRTNHLIQKGNYNLAYIFLPNVLHFISFFWRSSTLIDEARRTTFVRTPLDEWSARRSDLYLTAHNTRNRQTSGSPVGFEPTISGGKRPQTYASDRADAGIGNVKTLGHLNSKELNRSYREMWCRYIEVKHKTVNKFIKSRRRRKCRTQKPHRHNYKMNNLGKIRKKYFPAE